MTRTGFATLLARACIAVLVISSCAQLFTSLGKPPPIGFFFLLFLTVAVITGAIGLLQMRVEMIEREWPLFTYESIRTLYRRFPLWVAAIVAAMIVWHVLVFFTLGDESPSYPMIGIASALELGAVQSLRRQPWLLEQLTCPDGHPIVYYNRFCPTCGVSLPKISGSG